MRPQHCAPSPSNCFINIAKTCGGIALIFSLQAAQATTLDEFFNRGSLLKSKAELTRIAGAEPTATNENSYRYTIASCDIDVVFVEDSAEQLHIPITANCQPDINVLQQLDNPFDNKTALTVKKFAEHAGDPSFRYDPKQNLLYSYIAGIDSGGRGRDASSASLLAISSEPNKTAINAWQKLLKQAGAGHKKTHCQPQANQSIGRQIEALAAVNISTLILGWQIEPLPCPRS